MYAHFNSIKVQLEQIMIRLEIVGNLFQFHKGTIRTVACEISKEHGDISIP